ncbi:trypsin-like serine protease [Streptomyces sp. NPDC059396]|uniref:trypsin-like serine protease n=1 Tax=Streptomyces sp. NPDC059396 TaxID=3346819 RepID=UPI00367EE30E
MIPVKRGFIRRAVLFCLSGAALALALPAAGPALAVNGPALTGAGTARTTIGNPVAGKTVTDEATLRGRVVSAGRAVAAQQAEEPAATAATTPSTAGDKGSPSPFIIGGTETTIASAPWMVQLWYADEAADEYYFCGGTLVAPNKVLTAAHCVNGLDWRSYGVVNAGVTSTESNGVLAGVARQWQHRSYDDATVRNDIAVLTLDRPLKQQWLRLAQTHDSALYKAGTTATVYGWGLTSGASDALATKLRKVSLPLVSDTACNTSMKKILGRDYFVEGSMICAGTPATGSDAGTKATCSGDSGGPLIAGGKIIGIVSWGVEGCTAKGAYSVFTKVLPYTGTATPRIEDTDYNYDGRADLVARAPSGNLFVQSSKGTSLNPAVYVGPGWQPLSWALQTDVDRDGGWDILLRDKNDGRLHLMKSDPLTGAFKNIVLTTVSGAYASYAIPGDVTGDGRPDLVTTDTAGNGWVFPGKGNGEYNSRVKFATGALKGYKIFGRGDYSGDGKPDLLVRDTLNRVFLYRGTGSPTAPFQARITVRTGWTFTSLIASGDVTGDGLADVMARDTAGTLWLYPGTGKASADIFGARKQLATGYNKYNLLF